MADKPPTETCCCGCGVLIGVVLASAVWLAVAYLLYPVS